MLAVEELLEWAPGRARARLVVRDGGLLVRQGCVDTIATLEYMAQTIAACLGYEAFRAGAGVRVGMIVACRRMTIDRPIVAVGEQLDIGVERVRGSDYVSHFDAEVRDANGKLVSSASLTLVHGDQPPA